MISLEIQIKHIKNVIRRQEKFITNCRDKDKKEQALKEKAIMEAALLSIDILKQMVEIRKNEFWVQKMDEIIEVERADK
jgi:predicted secreted protein